MSEGYAVSDWLEGDLDRAVPRRPRTPSGQRRCSSEFVVESGWNTGQVIVKCGKPASHRNKHVANTHSQCLDQVFVKGKEDWGSHLASVITARLRASQPLLLEDVIEGIYQHGGLKAIIAHERSRANYCCEVGCGSGACETCPCCSAGWCVSGSDGPPDAPDGLAGWLEVAREHNPVAAALSAALGGGDQ